jgi:hypothetical protein
MDKTGGPAFPNTVKVTDEAFAELRGMTLRDYFAAKALPCAWESYERGELKVLASEDACEEAIARLAYAMADAMLEARKSRIG